jgi:nucleoside-diphosphate-sugar epimerase/2-polyprenyl-3-methyl-5-hydroxy-6-metoxy-1,4-benzoquinol methylase
MSILIIGGCGYIATELIDYVKINKSFNITVVDTEDYNNNVKKHTDITYIVGKYQDLPKNFFKNFTDIILLAGQGSVSNSKDLLNVIDNNVRNFAWLSSLLNKDQKLIYASSSSVYGRTDSKDVSEDFCKVSGYEPYNYYDWSKQNIDQICELRKDNLQFYGLRFGTVNGFSRNLRNDVMINSMCFNAKKNGKIFVTKNNVNRPILGIDDLCRAIVTIINKGSFEKSGLYNLNSFNSGLFNIAKSVAKICNVECEEINNEGTIVNFKLQTKSYDFRINSDKFINTFDFKFQDTLETITNNLLDKWCSIENLENRLVDKFRDYKIITKCRVCNNTTNSLLDLGIQPLANSYTKYHNTLDYNQSHINIEDKYPLHLHYCKECFHVQLNCIVNPEKLFKNYVYISGTSKTLKDYFKEFAKQCILDSNKKCIKVLDIACNDGSQLDAFNELDNDIITVGVDPAVNIYNDISSHKKEHDIYCDFFNENIAKTLKGKYDKFDIIIAQNVFAHTDDIYKFLELCKEVMDKNTTLYIQTSQKNMIINNQFDTAYAEHLSFFNANSMNVLCKNNDLYLNNVFENEIHGTSYIFEISKIDKEASNTSDVILNELLSGLYSKNTYVNYPLKCLRYKNNLQNKLIDYKLSGKNIIGYGSTAKGQVCLNFANIDNNIIDYIIDENQLKQNLFTPGGNILISDFTALKTINKNTVIVIIAWNFYNEILQKIKNKLHEFKIDFPVEILNMDNLQSEII